MSTEKLVVIDDPESDQAGPDPVLMKAFLQELRKSNGYLTFSLCIYNSTGLFGHLSETEAE